MWTRATYDEFSRHLPFDIEVVWDKAPSMAKYGHVNSLLFALTVLLDHKSRLTDPDGKALTNLTIAPLRRKLTDRSKKCSTIIGYYPQVSPLMVAEYDNLFLEVYFNYHFFCGSETSFREYFPGASLSILARKNTSQSWNWDVPFIIETGPYGVPSSARKNFRGFKYLPSPFKIFICSKSLPKAEERYIHNNGFELYVVTNEMSASVSALKRRLDEFLREQKKRKRN